MMQLASTVRTLIFAKISIYKRTLIKLFVIPTTVLRPVGLELTKDENTRVETFIIKRMKLMKKNAR